MELSLSTDALQGIAAVIGALGVGLAAVIWAIRRDPKSGKQ